MWRIQQCILPLGYKFTWSEIFDAQCIFGCFHLERFRVFFGIVLSAHYNIRLGSFDQFGSLEISFSDHMLYAVYARVIRDKIRITRSVKSATKFRLGLEIEIVGSDVHGSHFEIPEALVLKNPVCCTINLMHILIVRWN